MINDFTKEELIWMRDNYNGFRALGVDGYPMMPIIVSKLESMIDNYCEHENEYTGFNYYNGCLDCGKKW